MIPQRIHLAILGATLVVLIAFLIVLCTPISAGAAARPKPCVNGRIETIVEGMTRRCVNGHWVAGFLSTALPSRTKVKP